jgi:cytochrome c-type biogenesis protein CcmH/NrfG
MLEELAQAHPEHVNARLLLGELLVGLGRAEEARAQYQAILEHDPENPAARQSLEWLSSSTGK